MKIYIVAGISLFINIIQPAQASECNQCKPKKTADAVHRNSEATGLWTGHAGFMAGNLVSNVIPGRDEFYRALAMSNWNDYVVNESLFWGAKRHKDLRSGLPPDLTAAIKEEITKKLRAKIRYDANHLNQKGGTFTESDGTQYFEYDCVGWVEYLYENILGKDLTPNSYESGTGWPLTVREQRDSENAVDVLNE